MQGGPPMCRRNLFRRQRRGLRNREPDAGETERQRIATEVAKGEPGERREVDHDRRGGDTRARQRVVGLATAERDGEHERDGADADAVQRRRPEERIARDAEPRQ